MSIYKTENKFESSSKKWNVIINLKSSYYVLKSLDS